MTPSFRKKNEKEQTSAKESLGSSEGTDEGLTRKMPLALRPKKRGLDFAHRNFWGKGGRKDSRCRVWGKKGGRQPGRGFALLYSTTSSGGAHLCQGKHGNAGKLHKEIAVQEERVSRNKNHAPPRKGGSGRDGKERLSRAPENREIDVNPRLRQAGPRMDGRRDVGKKRLTARLLENWKQGRERRRTTHRPCARAIHSVLVRAEKKKGGMSSKENARRRYNSRLSGFEGKHETLLSRTAV